MKLNRSVYYEPLHANSDEDISTTSWSGGRFASWTTRTRKDHRRRADSQCQKVPGAGYIASLCLAQHEFPRRETFMGWQLAGISQLSTTRYRSVVTVKRPASFKFSRAEHGSGIVAVVIAAIYRLRPPPPPWSGCCWWLALQKSELRNRGAWKGRSCLRRGLNYPTSPLQVEIRESFLSWLEFTSLRRYSFFSFSFSSSFSKYRTLVYRFGIFWRLIN